MASGYFLYFLDLIPPTILRLQTAAKLIMMSTVPANGLGNNGALGMSSFAVPHDMTETRRVLRGKPAGFEAGWYSGRSHNAILYPLVINT